MLVDFTLKDTALNSCPEYCFGALFVMDLAADVFIVANKVVPERTFFSAQHMRSRGRCSGPPGLPRTKSFREVG